MSARQEHQRRFNLRRAYIREFEYWAACEPPVLLFWRWRKWLKARPVPKGYTEIITVQNYNNRGEVRS